MKRRGLALLILLVAADHAASQDIPADKRCRQLAARALLTARVVSQVRSTRERLSLAEPLLQDVGKLADGLPEDKDAAAALVREVERLLGYIEGEQRVAQSHAWIQACNVCAQLAADDATRLGWIARGLANSAQGAPDSKYDRTTVVIWTKSFQNCAGTELSGAVKKTLEDAAQSILKRKWWARLLSLESDGAPKSEEREALLGAILNSTSFQAAGPLRDNIHAAARSLAKAAAAKPANRGRLAHGVAELSRLVSVAARAQEAPAGYWVAVMSGEDGLARLEPLASRGLLEPAESGWSQELRKTPTVTLSSEAAVTSVLVGVDSQNFVALPPLQPDRGWDAYCVPPKLDYLIELEGRQGGRPATVSCFTNWEQNGWKHLGDDKKLPIVRLLVPTRLPAGYDVIHNFFAPGPIQGMADEGPTWLIRRRLWTHQDLALTIFELSKTGAPSNPSLTPVREFFGTLTELRWPPRSAASVRQKVAANRALGSSLARALSEVCAKPTAWSLTGVRLPHRRVVDGVPRWVRTRWGWERLLTAPLTEGAPTTYTYQVRDVLRMVVK